MKAIFHLVIFIAGLLMTGVVSAEGEHSDHVYVILDTSISMKNHRSRDLNGQLIPVVGNDPSKLSVLSVKLLADLLHPIFSEDNDSLEVATFAADYGRWPARGLPTKQQPEKLIRLKGTEPLDWVDFKNDMNKVKRSSKVTYFYPSVSLAVESIRKKTVVKDGTKTIILITDGDSDSGKDKHGGPQEKQTELDKLRELANTMYGENIQLYIVAFGGAVATQGSIDFFETMLKTDQNQSIGELYEVSKTEDLMSQMAKLFSHRFGYSIQTNLHSPLLTSDPYMKISKAEKFTLSSGSDSPFVAVLSSERTNTPRSPDFTLQGTPYRGFNEIVKGEAQGSGGGYKLVWRTDVPDGFYDFVPVTPQDQNVIILRPIRVNVGVGGIGKPLDSTAKEVSERVKTTVAVVAEHDEPFFFYLKTEAAGGSVPDLKVSYSRRGEWLGQNYTRLPVFGSGVGGINSSASAAVSHNHFNSPVVSSLIESNTYGWYYTGEPSTGNIRGISFNKNKDSVNSPYWASLPVTANLRGRKVGSSEEKNALKVQVYPNLSYELSGSALTLKNSKGDPELKKGETGCASFKLRKNADYYSGFENSIPLKVLLQSQDGSPLKGYGQLNGASFTLDNDRFHSVSGKKVLNKVYTTGARSTEDQLQKGESGNEYKICMVVGHPTDGGKAGDKTVNLNLKLILDSYPYDRDGLTIIKPIPIKINVEEPTWKNIYFLWLLLLLLMLWLLKFVPKIEDDLRYTYFKEGNDKKLSLYKFEKNPISFFFRRIMNIAGNYQIQSIGSGKSTIAILKPLSNSTEPDDLYAIKMLKNNSLSVFGDTDSIVNEGSWMKIHVNIPYKLSLDGEEYIFRMEYK